MKLKTSRIAKCTAAWLSVLTLAAASASPYTIKAADEIAPQIQNTQKKTVIFSSFFGFFFNWFEDQEQQEQEEQTESESKSETQQEEQTESESKPETQQEEQTESESKPETQQEEQTESESKPETQQEEQTEPESKPETQSEEQTEPEVQPAADGSYVHSVNASAAVPEYYYPFTVDFLNAIRSGSSKLYYNGDDSQADLSLGEIVYDYSALSGGGAYYRRQDGSGKYLEVVDTQFPALQAGVAQADADWAAYPAQVEAALYSLNLNTTDRDLVDQINEYICANFDYQLVDNTSMPFFMNNRVGQCYHYAKLFADMCNAAGIPARKVETSEHAWDEVTVDGVTYTFDPSSADYCGDWTAFSWK